MAEREFYVDEYVNRHPEDFLKGKKNSVVLFDLFIGNTLIHQDTFYSGRYRFIVSVLYLMYVDKIFFL